MNRSREDVWLEGVERGMKMTFNAERCFKQQYEPATVTICPLFFLPSLAGDHRTYENPPALFALFATFDTSGIKRRHLQATV